MHIVSSGDSDVLEEMCVFIEILSTGKAARVREMKKNRENRDKAREVNLVQKDTRSLEKDIRFLQEKKTRSDAEQEELAKLQSELKRIRLAKEEYLAKNPEHRKFVYPREAEEKAEQLGRERAAQEMTKRNQPQRDPKRSIYYHEVFNPHGAPPPGMPYMEKSAEQWEAEQRKEFEGMMGSDGGEEESSDEEEDEDDIVLPEGPPPALPPSEQHHDVIEDEEEDSSADEDGIVMPKGPPPGPPKAPRAMQEGIPTGPSSTHYRPPLPTMYNRPPQLPSQQPPYMQYSMVRPPLPHNMPVRPLWSVPFRPAPPVSGPPGPPPLPPPTVITAAPVLRDLKKEATAFVPTALRKKQAALKAKAAKGGLPSAVNAAPVNHSHPSSEGASEQLEERVDLMSTLQPHMNKRGA